MTARPVLLAHHDAEALESLTMKLTDKGYHVVGPAQTAGVALTLAAQVPVNMALISKRLLGRRDGEELARTLMESWGVRSFVLADEAEPAPLP